MKAYKKANLSKTIEKMRPKTAEEHKSKVFSKTELRQPTNLTEEELQAYVYRELTSEDFYENKGYASYTGSGFEMIATSVPSAVPLFVFEPDAVAVVEKLRLNSFSNASRPAQIGSSERQEKGIESTATTTVEYQGSVTQGLISQYYEERASIEREKKAIKKPIGEESSKYYRVEVIGKKKQKSEFQIVSRMAAQNVFQDVIADFRYWNDPSDGYKEPVEGNFLPLWDISPIQMSSFITATWFPNVLDKYIVVSKDPLLNDVSLLTIVDLKDPSNQKVLSINKSIKDCTMSFKQVNQVLLVSSYAIGILNIQTSQVLWSNSFDLEITSAVFNDTMEGYIVFKDATVYKWRIINNAIHLNDKLSLELPDCDYAHFDSTCNKLLIANDHSFIVYNIKTSESSLFESFHEQSILKASFNPYNSDLIIVITSDWQLSLWNITIKEPLCVLIADSLIIDVKWLPYAPNRFIYLLKNGKVLYIYID